MTLAEHPDDYDVLKEALDERLVLASEQESDAAGAAIVGGEAKRPELLPKK